MVKSSVLTLTGQICNVGLFWNSQIKVKHGIFSASSILVSLCCSSLQILCKAQVVMFSGFLIKTTNCLIFRTFNHMKLGPLTKFDKGNMMTSKNWQWRHVAKFWPHCHFFGLLPIWSNPRQILNVWSIIFKFSLSKTFFSNAKLKAELKNPYHSSHVCAYVPNFKFLSQS